MVFGIVALGQSFQLNLWQTLWFRELHLRVSNHDDFRAADRVLMPTCRNRSEGSKRRGANHRCGGFIDRACMSCTLGRALGSAR